MTKRRDALPLRLRPTFKLAFISSCERRVWLALPKPGAVGTVQLKVERLVPKPLTWE